MFPFFSYNLKSLAARWQITLLAVFGVATVVAVFVVLQAMAAGFLSTLKATGLPGNAIVVQKGARSEPASFFPRDQALSLAASSAVGHAGGDALASPEVVVVVTLPGRRGEPVNVTLRGVTPRATGVRGGLRVGSGRLPVPGTAEIMVGERIRRRVAGLEPGDSLRLQGRDFRVVGAFSAEGGAFESEIWGPLDVVGQAFHRDDGQSSLAVRLASPDALAELTRAIAADPRMRLEVQREDAFYEAQSSSVTTPLLALAGFVVVVMGIGAIFAALNTMSAVVSSRVREVAALRAVGFGRLGILAGFLLESAALGLAGGVLGCVLSLPAHGLRGGTGNTAGSAEVAWPSR
jgi:putative ABC transport system permease protein